MGFTVNTRTNHAASQSNQSVSVDKDYWREFKELDVIPVAIGQPIALDGGRCVSVPLVGKFSTARLITGNRER